jgi:hypothetical protein
MEAQVARDHAGRNRMIAIAAGAITVIAIVLGFAGDFLGLPWRWMRPAAELLLLAELVGLVVLERHQLFEPVHENVGALRTDVGAIQTRMDELHAMMTENMRTSGQVTACTTAAEIYRTMTRVMREALARDQQAPQILRIARLAGRLISQSGVLGDADLAAEWREYAAARLAYMVTPGSPTDGSARRWSVRAMITVATFENLDASLEQFQQALSGRPSNVEVKFLLRPRIEAMLSPALMTDRDAVMTFDDAVAPNRWGVWFQSAQYLALFERWFDDLWANIPDNYLVYSHRGFNQSAIDRIRKELAAIESAQASQIG